MQSLSRADLVPSELQTIALSKQVHHVLRDQGISYGDYIEQITYLLFLKMDQERVDFLGEASAVPPEWRWEQLASKSGDALELHYRHTLEALASAPGLIGCPSRRKKGPVAGGILGPFPGSRLPLGARAHHMAYAPQEALAAGQFYGLYL